MKLRLALTSLLAWSAASCQTYSRQSLNLGAYAADWRERITDIEPIREYAAQLSASANADAPFDASDGLSLSEAEAVALHFNPALRIARSRAKVPLAGAVESGWWPDPQFEAEVLRFLDRGDKTRYRWESGSVTGVNAGGIESTPAGFRRVDGDYIDDPWIVGAGLTLTIPISGRIAVETDVRWSEYDLAWRQILLQEWRLVTTLRSAWLEWSASTERVRITLEYLAQLETIADITQRLVSAGEMKPTEGRLIQIELARWQAASIDYEHDETIARLELLSIMGLAPASTVQLKPKLSLDDSALHVMGTPAQLLANHPEVQSVEALYENAEQRLRLEIVKQYPDVDIGPSYSLEEGFDRFGLGLGFPIPLWNRNRQAIAEAHAARDAARVQAQVVVEQVLSHFVRVERNLTFARRRRYAILDHVVPLTDRQVEDSRMLLSLGEVDVLLLRDALERSLNTKLDLIDAAVSEGQAANELHQMLQPQWFTPSEAVDREDPS